MLIIYLNCCYNLLLPFVKELYLTIEVQNIFPCRHKYILDLAKVNNFYETTKFFSKKVNHVSALALSAMQFANSTFFFPLTVISFLRDESYVYNLETYVSKLETYVPKLETYISKLET